MGKTEGSPMQKMKVGTQDYPIAGYVKSEGFGVVPMVDIKLMSDYEWQLTSMQERLRNPELYRTVFGEDVEAVIEGLRKWLKKHAEEGAATA